ncbi:hypothetical protein BU17DRAFT_67046 [Hysterangium stoloniferum]|nr:hypothetical protein BU17DRAFT_67046 [Hysterangium stoloniferum]
MASILNSGSPSMVQDYIESNGRPKRHNVMRSSRRLLSGRGGRRRIREWYWEHSICQQGKRKYVNDEDEEVEMEEVMDPTRKTPISGACNVQYAQWWGSIACNGYQQALLTMQLVQKRLFFCNNVLGVGALKGILGVLELVGYHCQHTKDWWSTKESSEAGMLAQLDQSIFGMVDWPAMTLAISGGDGNGHMGLVDGEEGLAEGLPPIATLE